MARKKYLYEDNMYIREIYDDGGKLDFDYTNIDKPETPYFLDFDNDEIRMAQDRCFDDPSLTFVENHVLKTSSGDDTFYTGYL